MHFNLVVRSGVAVLAFVGSAGLTTRAQDAQPLISHLDQELHRLVIVAPESGNVYLYAVNSDDLKLLAFRNMATDRDSVRKPEPQNEAVPARLPDTDVPGQDLTDVPRPIASRRVLMTISESSDGSSAEVGYFSLEPAAKIYEQLITGFAGWKITSRGFNRVGGGVMASIHARRAAVTVSVVVRSTVSEFGKVTEVKISRTEKSVGS